MQRLTRQSAIPDQLKGLFCEPPLLGGEDPALYWGLLAGVVAERKPVTASDWIAVNDLVTKLWEERLFRRASNALVRGEMMQKVAERFAMEQEEQEEQEESESEQNPLEEFRRWQQQRAAAARRLRAEYCNETPKERKAISLFQARFGVTEAELYATTFKQNSEALLMFEHMIASRERTRRKLRKEDERRRRRKDRQMEGSESE